MGHVSLLQKPSQKVVHGDLGAKSAHFCDWLLSSKAVRLPDGDALKNEAQLVYYYCN